VSGLWPPGVRYFEEEPRQAFKKAGSGWTHIRVIPTRSEPGTAPDQDRGQESRRFNPRARVTSRSGRRWRVVVFDTTMPTVPGFQFMLADPLVATITFDETFDTRTQACSRALSMAQQLARNAGIQTNPDLAPCRPNFSCLAWIGTAVIGASAGIIIPPTLAGLFSVTDSQITAVIGRKVAEAALLAAMPLGAAIACLLLWLVGRAAQKRKRLSARAAHASDTSRLLPPAAPGAVTDSTRPPTGS